jgi:hypothetical protein
VGPDESLLLVGSVAEGLAHANSDLDLLLLERDDPESAPPLHQDTLTARPDGLSVNVEIVGIDAMRALCRRFVSCLDTAARTTPATPMLAYLGADDQRLLHRLATGVVLADPTGIANGLRQEYRLAALADFCMLQHASCFLRLCADARYAADDAGTVRLMAALAARHLVSAVLASAGETNPNPKWCLRLLRDHAPELGAFDADRLAALLIPSPDGSVRTLVDDLARNGDKALATLQERAWRAHSPMAGALETVRAGHA